MLSNSRLDEVQVISQRKKLWSQRILELSSMRKETIDKGIFKTGRNDESNLNQGL